MEESNENKHHSITNTMFKSTVVGAFSAATIKTIQAPFVTAHLHTMGVIPTTGTTGGGYLYFWKRIFEEAGLMGLWRGNLRNIIYFTPLQALSFGFFEVLRKLNTSETSYGNSLITNCLNGGLAGAAAMTVVHPLNTFHRNRGNRTEDSILKTIRNVIRSPLDKFYVPSLVHQSIYRGLLFGIFSTYSTDSIPLNVLTAYAAQNIAGITVHPINRIQIRFNYANASQPQTAIGMMRHVVQTEGIRSLWKGAWAFNMTRGWTTALMLVIYDTIMKYTG